MRRLCNDNLFKKWFFVKNRKHFLGMGTKVNDVLPEIHKEFMVRLLNTVDLLNKYPH